MLLKLSVIEKKLCNVIIIWYIIFNCWIFFLIIILGILGQIQNCAFFIGVTLLKDILGIINIISVTLQSKNATLGKAKSIINGSIQSIEKLRSDIEFSTFWQKITSLAEENAITLEVPHKGKY